MYPLAIKGSLKEPEQSLISAVTPKRFKWAAMSFSSCVKKALNGAISAFLYFNVLSVCGALTMLEGGKLALKIAVRFLNLRILYVSI